MNRLLVLRIQIVNVQHVPVVLLTSIRYQRAQPHLTDSALRVKHVQEALIMLVDVLVLSIVFVQHVPVALLISIRHQHVPRHRIDSVQHVKRAVQEHIQVVDV